MGKRDFGILGFGLAGAVLAGELLTRGATVAVASQSLPGAASPIAPGLVNPLAGRKLRPDPLLPSWLSTLQILNLRWGAFFGESFWRNTPIIRLLENPQQKAALDALEENPTSAVWVGTRRKPGAWGSHISDNHGSFTTRGSGWFDISHFVERMATHPQIRWVEPESLANAADRWIDCRGWRCSLEPRWKFLPWNCARGEILEIEVDPGELPSGLIWNRGLWMRPIRGWRWLVGSTYAWDPGEFAAPPTEAAAEQLIKRLRRWLHGEVRVLQQFAGTRAVVTDYRPVLGEDPKDSRWFLFSGLGSKGALYAPYYGRALADHLLDRSGLPEEVDLARFAQPGSEG